MTTFVPTHQKVVKVSVQNSKNSKNYQRPAHQPTFASGKAPRKRGRGKPRGSTTKQLATRVRQREEVKVVCLNSNVTMNVTNHYKSRDVTTGRFHTIQIRRDELTSDDDYDVREEEYDRDYDVDQNYDVINDESDVEVAR